MVLDIKGGLFGEGNLLGGIPKEARATVNKKNGVMAILSPLGGSGGTQYWSCPGSDFTTRLPYSHQVEIQNGKSRGLSTTIVNSTGVYLPNGAIVTACICYGNASDETWTLSRIKISDATTSNLATANFNTEDTSIDNATIDNTTYAYFIQTSSLDAKEIYGARITYTSTGSTANIGAITISTQTFASTQKLKGFKGTVTLNNQTGVQQNITYTLVNTTRTTTLESVTHVLANGEYAARNFIWGTGEIAAGDVITFTMTAGAIGTSAAGTISGYASFHVENIEETDEAT